jgi:plastocyanin
MTRSRKISFVITLAALLFAMLSLFWNPGERPVAAAPATIGFHNYEYVPANVVINIGETVTWQPDAGYSFADHPLRFDTLPQYQVNSGTDPFVLSFPTAGRWRFYCNIHGSPLAGGMSGTVTVVDPNGPPTPTPTMTPTGSALYVPGAFNDKPPTPIPTSTPTQTPTVTPTPTVTQTPTPTSTPTFSPNPPGPPSQFFARPTDGTHINISWTNPPDASLTQYRLALCHSAAFSISPNCPLASADVFTSFFNTSPNQFVSFDDFGTKPGLYTCAWVQFNGSGGTSIFYPGGGTITLTNCSTP